MKNNKEFLEYQRNDIYVFIERFRSNIKIDRHLNKKLNYRGHFL